MTMDEADPEYADRVIAAAKAEVRRCCAELAAVRGTHDIELQVQTKVRLSQDDESVLRNGVERSLPDPRERWSIRTHILPVDPRLAGDRPDYDIKASPRDEPPRPGPPRPRRLGERELLTLRSGESTLTYLLIPSDTWIDVRRRDGGRDQNPHIAIPAELNSVSRRPLVQLRVCDGRLEARPTGGRRGMSVLVDDSPLTQREIPERGMLSFVAGKARTDIEYQLTPWRDEPLEPTSGRIADSPDEYDVVHRFGDVDVTLTIAAPKVGVEPMERGFQVKAPQFEGGYMAVPAQVLYTTAESRGTGPKPDHWHIKIFRTPTPEHAAFLRDTFSRQAGAIREVIRTSIAPCGIAPVHVIDQSRQYRAAPDPTRFGSPPEARIDGVFGEWFGVAGVQSDSVAVVASPELGKRTVEREPSAPALFQLVRFRAMAAALDECHRRRFAHCDLKPSNYRKRGGDYVLIDADSVTDIDSQPTWLPYTPPYATKEMLRNNPPERYDGPALFAEQIVEHDRFGFGLLVLGAVVGDRWLTEDATDGMPGSRIVDKLADLRNALAGQWPNDQRWRGLVEVLVEPFDGDRVNSEGWGCAEWLERVIARANISMATAAAKVMPRYRGPYHRAFAGVRADVGRDPIRPVVLREVHTVVENKVAQVQRQSWWWTFGPVGGLGVIALLLTLAVRVLGWLP
jgi:hypothetical protein